MRARTWAAVAVAAVLGVGAAPAAGAAEPAAERSGTLEAVDGSSLFDGRLTAGSVQTVTLPPASSVVLSVRTSEADRDATLDVRGAGRAPTPSDVHARAGLVTVTTVVVRPDAAGQVTLTHRAGAPVRVAVGVQASVPLGTVVPEGGFEATPAVRVAGPGPAGSRVGTRHVRVAGVGAIPATGIRAVVLAVTVPRTAGLGLLGAFSDDQLAGTAPPGVVAQLWYTGSAVSGTVVAAVRDGEAVLAENGSGLGLAALRADVVAVVRGSATPPGSLLTAPQQRLVDSSSGGAGRLAAGATVRVTVPLPQGPTDTTAVPVGARGVVLAVQTSNGPVPSAVGFAGSGASTAARSDVGYGTAPQAATVVVALGPDRTFLVTNQGPFSVSLTIVAVGALAGSA